MAAMRRAHVRRAVFQRPVSLTFLFDDGLDCSNHAVIIKAVEDAMKGWVIVDDNPRYVKSITTGFHDAGCIQVEVMEL